MNHKFTITYEWDFQEFSGTESFDLLVPVNSLITYQGLLKSMWSDYENKVGNAVSGTNLYLQTIGYTGDEESK